MISIIIPTYNEHDNIHILLSRLAKSVLIEHEIIVVDDNSPDGTGDLVARFSKTLPKLRLIRRQEKKGLTSAIVAGVNAAKGNKIVVMDADLSHPPELIPSLISKLNTQDLVIGSRLIKGGGVENWSIHRKLISNGAEFLARLLLKVSVSDPLSGFFAVRRKVLNNTRFRTKGYKILLNILADNPKLELSEVPYIFKDRCAGETKLDSKEMITYVFDLIRLKLA